MLKILFDTILIGTQVMGFIQAVETDEYGWESYSNLHVEFRQKMQKNEKILKKLFPDNKKENIITDEKYRDFLLSLKDSEYFNLLNKDEIDNLNEMLIYDLASLYFYGIIRYQISRAVNMLFIFRHAFTTFNLAVQVQVMHMTNRRHHEFFRPGNIHYKVEDALIISFFVVVYIGNEYVISNLVDFFI